MHLEIVNDDGLVDIVGRGFDAGIRFEEQVPEDMVAVHIGTPLRLVVVGAPDYFTRHPVPTHPDELLEHDCVRHRFASGRFYRWEFEKGNAKIEMAVEGPRGARRPGPDGRRGVERPLPRLRVRGTSWRTPSPMAGSSGCSKTGARVFRDSRCTIRGSGACRPALRAFIDMAKAGVKTLL